MKEILERGVFLNCLLDQTEAPWEVEAEMIRCHDAALRLALAEAQLENAIERDKREAAEIALAEDRCVCLCGCPISEHEGRMEDGEQCEHEDHECIRVAPAVLEIVGRVRLALETATRERDEAVRKLAEAEETYCREHDRLALAPPPEAEKKGGEE